MEAALRELRNRFGIERWETSGIPEICAGCRSLEDRVFFAFEGPRPELHINCCGKRGAVDVSGLSGVALIQLVLEARSNGRQARFLEEEATRRRLGQRTEQAARGRRFR
jgi:hypothetical protein